MGFLSLYKELQTKRGVFHPIAFMVLSHETESDFYSFYQGLIKLANELDLE